MSINVKMIKDSFNVARPLGVKVTDKFYEILFTNYPESKPLFADINMEKQKTQLLNSIAFAVDNLENTDKLIPFLETLGKRHNNYGVIEAHYQLVGDSLLKTFAFFFADKWTTELNAEWTKVYTTIAEVMIKGSRA